MRLTLRTLLAYVNDSGLNPKQRKEIKSRMQQSENARKLLQHIKVVTSDPGIESLNVGLRSNENDPNRIAQYLDSTMPDESVAEYEKKCLASAPLICEIVNCHSILAKVFRHENVPVPLGIRQRVYSLAPVAGDLEGDIDDDTFDDSREVRVPTISPNRILSRSNATDDNQNKPSNGASQALSRAKSNGTSKSSSGNFECAAPNAESESEKQTLHRETGGRFRSKMSFSRKLGIAACMLVILGIGLGGGFLIAGGQLPFLADGSSDADKVHPEKNADTPAKGDSDSGDDNEQKEDPSGDSDPAKSESAGNKDKADLNGEKTNPKVVDKDDTKQAVLDSNEKGKPKLPVVVDSPVKMPEDVDSADTQPKVTPAQAPQPPKPMLARLQGSKNLMVFLDDDKKNWRLFETNASIHQDTLCKSFEGTQSRLELGTAKIQIAGRAEFSISSRSVRAETIEDGKGDIKKAGVKKADVMQSEREQKDEPKRSGDENQEQELADETIYVLKISVGTFGLILPEGNFEIDAAGRQFQISVERPQTTLWVHVENISPTRELGQWKDRIKFVNFLMRKGALSIKVDDQKIDLSGRHAMEFIGTGEIATGTLVKHPRWFIGAEEQDSLVELAINPLLDSLDRTKPIEAQLTELTTSLRPEVRSMSTRMLSWLGYYEPLVQLLNDDFCRSFWARSFNGFRTDLANNPDLVENLQSLVKDESPQSNTLYKLLVGPTDEQLANGDDKLLVEELSNQILANRVLAIENLQRIFEKSFRFRPEVDVQSRKRSIALWQNELRRKRIAYKTPFVFPRLDLAKTDVPSEDDIDAPVPEDRSDGGDDTKKSKTDEKINGSDGKVNKAEKNL